MGGDGLPLGKPPRRCCAPNADSDGAWPKPPPAPKPPVCCARIGGIATVVDHPVACTRVQRVNVHVSKGLALLLLP